VKREWKPGDLAMVRVQITTNPDDGSEEHMLFRRRGKWEHPDFGIWEDRYVLAARPLVVIDPEDREQVERLFHLFADEREKDERHLRIGGWEDAMQAALRSLIAPPKCSAALNVAGEHFGCDSEAGHSGAHNNRTHEAIWQGPEATA